jgi:hypothetical protein
MKPEQFSKIKLFRLVAHFVKVSFSLVFQKTGVKICLRITH